MSAIDDHHQQGRRPRGRAVPPPSTGQARDASTAAAVERLRRLCSDPATPVECIDEAYVEAITPELRATAATLYQQHGRGIILINVGTTDPRRMARGEAIPSLYVSETLRQTLGMWWSPEMRQTVRDYDPEHVLLVMVYHDTEAHLFQLERRDRRG